MLYLDRSHTATADDSAGWLHVSNNLVRDCAIATATYVRPLTLGRCNRLREGVTVSASGVPARTDSGSLLPRRRMRVVLAFACGGEGLGMRGQLPRYAHQWHVRFDAARQQHHARPRTQVSAPLGTQDRRDIGRGADHAGDFTRFDGALHRLQ